MPTTNNIKFILNDEDIILQDLRPTDTLLDFLRLKHHLTGTKEGCAEGDCGACTVLIGCLIDNELHYQAVNSCIRLMGSLNGCHIVTVEYLARQGQGLHPIQQAMVDNHASQCGFCTPGFVMSLYGLWLIGVSPTRQQIEKTLQGNLCRCTGYESIIKAAEQLGKISQNIDFDPLIKNKNNISTRLQAMHNNQTIALSFDEGRVFIPNSIEELAQIIKNEPKATLVAGGTDIGLLVTKHMQKFDPIIFINNLPALQKITCNQHGIIIGAGVTYSRAFAILKEKIPNFAKLIHRIGGEQIRNMGTIGGNIANGSPIGDSPPALIALGATIKLRSSAHVREIALEDYFISYGKQNRHSDEFIESIFVPYPEEHGHYAVYKISKRRDEDISTVLGAFYLLLDNNKVKHIHIAYGGMAATPKRAKTVESALIDKAWTEENIINAYSSFDIDYQPVSDLRASAEYRQLTAKNLLLRFYLETVKTPQHLKRFASAEA